MTKRNTKDIVAALDEIAGHMSEARRKWSELSEYLKASGPGVYAGYSVLPVKRSRIKAHWRKAHNRIHLHPNY